MAIEPLPPALNDEELAKLDALAKRLTDLELNLKVRARKILYDMHAEHVKTGSFNSDAALQEAIGPAKTIIFSTIEGAIDAVSVFFDNDELDLILKTKFILLGENAADVVMWASETLKKTPPATESIKDAKSLRTWAEAAWTDVVSHLKRGDKLTLLLTLMGMVSAPEKMKELEEGIAEEIGNLEMSIFMKGQAINLNKKLIEKAQKLLKEKEQARAEGKTWTPPTWEEAHEP